MKVALVTSDGRASSSGVDPKVEALGHALACRGVEVEVLAQGPVREPPGPTGENGVVVRHFPIARGLWRHLRRTSRSVNVVHVHSAPPPLGLGVARAGLRRLVFTPRAPIERLLHWPYAHMTQAAVGRALRTVCTSRADADLVRCSFPWAAKRLRIVPTGVDVNAIRAATPLAYPGRVVLTIGPLERRKRIERAIAAMASLDPEFRLVVVGDGPARRRLRAYAADLEVSSRVEFVGWVSEPVLHRWLRTARVIVALAERANAGLPVLEALSAGAPVVASDIQVHHEAASYAAGGGLRFVSPEGSPLEVADAIEGAARIGVHATGAVDDIPSSEAVADGMLALYEALGQPGVALEG